MTFSEFSVLYKDGQLKLEQAIRIPECTHVVYFVGSSTKIPMLALSLRVLNTAKWEDESFAHYDSQSAEEGEIVYQMHFNDHVDRKPLPYGLILACCSSFLDPDGSGSVVKTNMEEINTPEFLDALGALTITYLRKKYPNAPDRIPMYFVFYGITKAYDEASEPVKELESALLKSFVKSKEYGVFRCFSGASSDENSYLAIYCETVDRELKDQTLGMNLKDLKLRPAKIRRTRD